MITMRRRAPLPWSLRWDRSYLAFVGQLREDPSVKPPSGPAPNISYISPDFAQGREHQLGGASVLRGGENARVHECEVGPGLCDRRFPSLPCSIAVRGPARA